MKFKNLHDINTFQCHRNEVYLAGKDENGEDITIVFDTIELLEWLDKQYMTEQALKYIKELGDDENLLQSSQKHLNN
tara:strand:- start:2327 stop:2557 length:231 start_codon:yes stop_codon:yes gene_type:complete